MGKMLVNEIEKYVISEGELLSCAIERLCKNEHKGLVVVKKNTLRPVGVFTRRDMVNCSHVFCKCNVCIDEYINRKFYFVTNELDLNEIEIRYTLVPVLDNGGTLKSIFFPEYEGEKDIENISVVINAGGKGTRLFPYTEFVPKPLVRVVDDRPMIDLIIDRFKGYGAHNFSIIVNHKKKMIKKYFNSKHKDYNVSFFDEEIPLGTGGGLYYLRGKIKDTFFFSNCDILVTENLSDMYEYHKASGKIATMIVSLKLIPIPYGVILADESQNIQYSLEKPTYTIMVNTGVYILEPQIFNYIKEKENIGFPSILDRARKDGCGIGVYPITADRWLDMGQIDELEYAKRLLAERLKKQNCN